jgi:multiple sugar transport system substrate-binding protein
MPVNAKSATIEVILNEEHDLIMTGSVNVDAGLKEMSKRVSEELEK